MEKLAPLAVAGPFLIAALFAISMPLSRRRDDIVSIVTASAGVVFVGAMLIDVLSRDVPVVTWVGGWQPRAGVALGISMAFDPLSTSLALLAAVLVCAAFLFAWRYFETPGPIFHALMLVFGGAMAGFCLSGDLFNLFVFFELMSVTAYALTAYRSEESGPLQGALTFAVSNTVGAVFYGSKGYVAIWDEDHGRYQSFLGKEQEPGPSGEDRGNNWANFIAAVRTGKQSDLNAPIEEGAISTTLVHLANISYRLGRSLNFDAATYSCTGDEEANRMFARNYRAPFVVPKLA